VHWRLQRTSTLSENNILKNDDFYKNCSPENENVCDAFTSIRLSNAYTLYEPPIDGSSATNYSQLIENKQDKRTIFTN
jgi:hypothetical protein